MLNALRVVVDPDLRRDIVSLGFVKDLAIADGRVVVHDRADDAGLSGQGSDARSGRRRGARAAGVADVDVQLTAKVRSASAPGDGPAAAAGREERHRRRRGQGRRRQDDGGRQPGAGAGALRQPRRHPRRRHLRAERADHAGPHNTQLTTDDQRDRARGEVRRPGHLDRVPDQRRRADHLARADAARAIQQFFREVAWKDLDYLIIDMPPGHRRRGAQPEPDRAGRRRRRRDDAAAGVAGRQPPRRADVSEAQHPDDRHRREHELLHRARTATTKPTSSAMAAARRWRRT